MAPKPNLAPLTPIILRCGRSHQEADRCLGLLPRLSSREAALSSFGVVGIERWTACDFDSLSPCILAPAFVFYSLSLSAGWALTHSFCARNAVSQPRVWLFALLIASLQVSVMVVCRGALYMPPLLLPSFLTAISFVGR